MRKRKFILEERFANKEFNRYIFIEQRYKEFI